MQALQVLFVGAHPDDETVMAGGMLAMLAERGIPTCVLCVTDGRGGESGGLPEASTPEQRAVVRERELRCAVKALGVRDLFWLGYEDPAVGPDDTVYPIPVDEPALVAHIARVMRQTGATAILTHGSDGEYGHPAHQQVHRAVLQAAREQSPEVVVYGIAGRVPGIDDRLWNDSDLAHLALDITPWIDAKHEAMLCHRTQHALFKRRRRLQTVREAIRTVESVHRHYPALPHGAVPDDPLADLLRAAGAWLPTAGR